MQLLVLSGYHVSIWRAWMSSIYVQLPVIAVSQCLRNTSRPTRLTGLGPYATMPPSPSGKCYRFLSSTPRICQCLVDKPVWNINRDSQTIPIYSAVSRSASVRPTSSAASDFAMPVLSSLPAISRALATSPSARPSARPCS